MKIAILGVGNILLKDEGVGVRVIKELENHYSFPFNIELIDGGTAGHHLINIVSDFDEIIVVDAVEGGEKPGTLYRFQLDQITFEIPTTFSLHQVGVLEVLSQLKLLNKAPRVTFIGIEPLDISPWGMVLSPLIEDKIPELMELVLKELEQLGAKRSFIVSKKKLTDVCNV
jgi:hydrogenase maturation protease